MFLLRSIFWLTVAFLLIVPRDVDLSQTAGALSDHVMAAGEKIIVDQINQNTCATLKCASSQALIAAAIAASDPSAGSTMQDSPAPDAVPMPRPRPNRTTG